jgi:CrcB protein
LNYFWIALGSGVGGTLRYACSGMRIFGDQFPWATLFVNVTGSLIIGILAATIPPEGRILGADARAFIMIGVCGGFTTFSTFSLETLNLARGGDWGAAAGYTLGSFILCLAAVTLGYFAASSFVR